MVGETGTGEGFFIGAGNSQMMLGSSSMSQFTEKEFSEGRSQSTFDQGRGLNVSRQTFGQKK
jgi:hypothetical protein